MKKHLLLLSCCFPLSTSIVSVSCSWSIPPLTVSEIETIMKDTETMVINSSNEKNGYIANYYEDTKNKNKLTIQLDDGNQNKDSEQTLKPWYDSISQAIIDKIAAPKKGDINLGKDITTGQQGNYKLFIQKLNLLQNYYFTMRIADIGGINLNISKKDLKDYNITWLTDLPGHKSISVYKEATVSLIQQKANYSNTFKNAKDNYFHYMAIEDIKLLRQMKNNSYFIVRYLFSFTPNQKKFNNVNPVAFYLDAYAKGK